MPREHCNVCREFIDLSSDDVNRHGKYECPQCGTWLGNAKATKFRGK